MFTLAQYTEKGEGLLGTGIELGGLFNSIKLDATSYEKVIKDFKRSSFDKPKFKLDDGSTDWDAIAKSIKGCDDVALSYFKTLEKEKGNINNAAASTQGLASHFQSAGLSAGFAAIKTTLLNTALNAGIGLIITFIGQGVVKFIQGQEKARQSAEDAANAYKESSLAINDQAAKYKELKAALEEANGNEEATYNIKKQLYEMQQNLIATYGDQAKGLDLVNGSLETQLSLIDGLSKADANKLLTRDGHEIEKAENAMTEERNQELGSGRLLSDDYNKIEKAAEKYKGITTYRSFADSDSYNISFNGSVLQGEEEILKFATDIRKMQEGLAKDNPFRAELEDILDMCNTALDKFGKVSDKWRAIYEEGQKARLIDDPENYTDQNGASQTAAEWLMDYSQAVQEYNDALLTGDQDTISEAGAKYEALHASITDMEKDAKGLGKYTGQFNDEINAQIEAKRIEPSQFPTASFSKNRATDKHLGRSISRLKKSLSPVRIISTSDTMAAFRIG